MTKRLFDIAVATVVLTAATPLLLVLAIVIRATSRGPVLHRGVRAGRGGVPFTLLKLRSMRVVAEEGPAITAGGDARITAVGRLIRATKLDELPQLWNVIRGDMSLVGPRPEDPRYVEWYTPDQRRVLQFRPGLTSPASVTFRDEERLLADSIANGAALEDAYRHVLAAKLAIDLAYFPNATLRSDIAWLLRTAVAVVPGSRWTRPASALPPAQGPRADDVRSRPYTCVHCPDDDGRRSRPSRRSRHPRAPRRSR